MNTNWPKFHLHVRLLCKNIHERQLSFTDEKKFNLDGPDGWVYYWHDLRSAPEILSRNRFAGCSVVCWAGMSFNGTTEIALFDCSVNLGYYQSIMQDYLLPDAERLCGPNW